MCVRWRPEFLGNVLEPGSVYVLGEEVLHPVEILDTASGERFVTNLESELLYNAGVSCTNTTTLVDRLTKMQLRVQRCR